MLEQIISNETVSSLLQFVITGAVVYALLILKKYLEAGIASMTVGINSKRIDQLKQLAATTVGLIEKMAKQNPMSNVDKKLQAIQIIKQYVHLFNIPEQEIAILDGIVEEAVNNLKKE